MTETRILLIDSDKQAISAVKESLSPFRVVLNVVGDPAQALGDGAKPDLILLRVELPTVSGYLISDRIKQNRTLASVPLVIYSSESGEKTFAHHQKTKSRGDTYLKLPFAKGEPLASVKKLVKLIELPDAGKPATGGKEATTHTTRGGDDVTGEARRGGARGEKTGDRRDGERGRRRGRRQTPAARADGAGSETRGASDSFSLDTIQETELDLTVPTSGGGELLDLTPSRDKLRSTPRADVDTTADDQLGMALDQALLASLESGGADLSDDLDIEAIMSELEALGAELDEDYDRTGPATSTGTGTGTTGPGDGDRGRDGTRDQRGRERGRKQQDHRHSTRPDSRSRSGGTAPVIRDGQRVIEAELAGARARAQALDATVHNLKQRLESTRKEGEREVNLCKDQISVLKDQLSAKEKVVEELQSKLDAQQHRTLEDGAKLQTRLEVANRDLTDVRRQLAQANEVNATLEQYKSALVATIESARQKFRDQLEKIRGEHKDELEQLARDHRGQMSELVESHAETTRLNREKFEEELAKHTRAAIKEHEARYAAENADLRRIQQEREMLVRDLRRAHDRTMAKWEEEKKSLIGELEDTHHRLANAEAITEELKGRFSDLRGGQASENESLRQEVGLARERIFTLEHKLAVAGDQIRDSARQLEDYRERSVQTLKKARASEKARQKAIRAVRIAMSLLDETVVAGGSGAGGVGRGVPPLFTDEGTRQEDLARVDQAIYPERRARAPYTRDHARFGGLEDRAGDRSSTSLRGPHTGRDDYPAGRHGGARGTYDNLGEWDSHSRDSAYPVPERMRGGRTRNLDREFSPTTTLDRLGRGDFFTPSTSSDTRKSYLDTRAALLAALEDDDEF